jgi:hypothetical protein
LAADIVDSRAEIATTLKPLHGVTALIESYCGVHDHEDFTNLAGSSAVAGRSGGLCSKESADQGRVLMNWQGLKTTRAE